MNKSHRVIPPVLMLLLAAVVMATPGCKSATPSAGKSKPWNIKVAKRTNASIQVDLMGISATEDDYWRHSVKPNDYWNPNKQVRKQRQADVVSTRFEKGDTFELPATDPHWTKWLGYGASELLIMADLPGALSNDDVDPRRLIIPLGKKAWQAKDTLEIEILDNQIRVLTQRTQ